MRICKVLIIEDEITIAELIKNRLELEYCEVIIAEDGETGFAQFQSEHPDLIILYLNLPKLNGYEVCRKIRKVENNDTPILMLTSQSQDADRIIGRVKGADGYMSKPFEAERLLKEVNVLLGR